MYMLNTKRTWEGVDVNFIYKEGKTKVIKRLMLEVIYCYSLYTI